MYIYSMHDKIAGYNAPLAFQSDDLAKRYFAYSVNNDQFLRSMADDLTLDRVADFDTSSGLMTPEFAHICAGKDVLHD